MRTETAATPRQARLGRRRRLRSAGRALRGAASLAALLWAQPAAAAEPWDAFQIIAYQPRSAAALATLQRLGVTAGMVIADRDHRLPPVAQRAAALLATGLPWYVENIATDFFAPYHRWQPDRPVNALFVAAQRRAAEDPADRSVFVRTPSLSDPAWQQRIRDRLTAVVQDQAQFHPLYYSLGDETGIADLTAFWDFDLAPESLAGFRAWLRRNYGTLAALNAEWRSAYTSWDAVVPLLTDAALQRGDGNFAAWADFKAWMDARFAGALQAGTAAVHAADPAALAGIEGAQMPGWGGYDYSHLAHVVDVMEIGDSGENLPIALALNPRLIALTTTAGADPAALHAIWRAWLRGTRGLILWDEAGDIVATDGTPGPRGRAYAPVFAALRGQAGRLLLASRQHRDPVAILYSPDSFRIQWLLDRQAKGDDWRRRDAERENEDNAVRMALRGYARALAHHGIAARWVTASDIAAGALDEARALLLPHAIALSDAAVAAIAGFHGTVIGDVPAGGFDGHGRRRAGPVVTIVPVASEDGDGLMRILAAAGVIPLVTVDAPDVEIHLFRHDAALIVGLQRDLGRDGPPVTLTLPRPMAVTDVRTGQSLGRLSRLRLTLDPVAPSLLALAPPDDGSGAR